MQLQPMASSPDGLISAWYAVIMKTPGWEVLTTTSNGGGTSDRMSQSGGYPPPNQTGCHTGGYLPPFQYIPGWGRMGHTPHSPPLLVRGTRGW